MTDEEYRKELDRVGPLDDLINKYQSDTDATDRYFLKEIVLWGLAENKKLSRILVDDGIGFSNTYNDLMKDFNK